MSTITSRKLTTLEVDRPGPGGIANLVKSGLVEGTRQARLGLERARSAVPERAADLAADLVADVPETARLAASGVAERARQARDTAPQMAQDLVTSGTDDVSRALDALLPQRRRRQRRRMLWLAFATTTVIAVLLAGRVLLRGLGTSVRTKPWLGAGGRGGPRLIRGDEPRPHDALAKHAPAGVEPDTTTRPATFERDAGIRATTEGMEPAVPEADEAASGAQHQARRARV